MTNGEDMSPQEYSAAVSAKAHYISEATDLDPVETWELVYRLQTADMTDEERNL